MQKWLHCRDDVLAAAQRAMAECQVRVAGSAAGEDTVLVAVHVRRTDFAEYSLKFNKGEHSGLLNASFYTAAMEHVRARHQQPVRFLVLREGNTYNLILLQQTKADST